MTRSFAKGAMFALAVLTLGVTAEAASPSSLPGTSVVMPVGDRDYYRPDVNAYGPTILHQDDSYLHDPDTAGADEIRELQRAFPANQLAVKHALLRTSIEGGKQCLAIA
jgi:hypothetical protein